MEIRNTTIKFSLTLKHSNLSKEKQLIKSIEKAETEETLSALEQMKDELYKIRETRHKGQTVRSRAQWIKYGENPAKFFCDLERKNFVDKTMKKIQLDNGKIINTQNEILDNVRLYYQNLFKSRDDELSDVNLEKLLQNIPINKLGKRDKLLLEGNLTTSELGDALKTRRITKHQALMAFLQIFKSFLGKLKFLATRVLNYCYIKGQLPISLRQSIINCLPKWINQENY